MLQLLEYVMQLLQEITLFSMQYDPVLVSLEAMQTLAMIHHFTYLPKSFGSTYNMCVIAVLWTVDPKTCDSIGYHHVAVYPQG